MAFGDAFASALNASLGTVLRQAIETKEARKRYAEYFSKQEEADRKRASDQSSLEAQRAQLEREEKSREEQAKKERRFAGPALGYLDPRTGGFIPGFVGGAPEGAQTIYPADVGKEGVGAILREGLKKPPAEKPAGKSYGSLGLALKDALSLAKAGNKEYAGLLGITPKDAPAPSPGSDVPEANQRGTFYEQSMGRQGIPQEMNVGGAAAPLAYPLASSAYDSLAQQIGAPGAFQRVLQQGLFEQPAVVGGLPSDFVDKQPVYAKGGKLYVKKNWGRRDEEITTDEARSALLESGLDERIVNAYLRQILGDKNEETTSKKTPDDGIGQDDLDALLGG